MINQWFGTWQDFIGTKEYGAMAGKATAVSIRDDGRGKYCVSVNGVPDGEIIREASNRFRWRNRLAPAVSNSFTTGLTETFRQALLMLGYRAV